MLSGRDALPAGRPLERASPSKLQPTAIVRVSNVFWLQNWLLQGTATPLPCLSKAVLKYGSRWREPEGGWSLRLRCRDTGRTGCLKAGNGL